MGILLPLLLINFTAAAEAVSCGETIQTFWKLNRQAKTLSFSSSYRHEERICDAERLTQSNGTVELLDRHKKLLRKIPIFLNDVEYFDQVSANGLRGGMMSRKSSTIQLKFAEGADFKEIRYLKLSLNHGEWYGPVSFF